jgi:hypothetical protein
MPVISATWEAEIRRIAVQGQPEQKVSETHISTNKLVMVADLPSQLLRRRPYLKANLSKKDWGYSSGGRVPA